MQNESILGLVPPIGRCGCGCGGLTPIATQNIKSKGWVKGQPKRFISGHNSRMFSREIRRKIGDANKGNVSHKGKHYTDAAKKKIGDANKGRISPMKGKHHSEETRRRMSDAPRASGKDHPMFGKKHSEGTKGAMRLAKIGKYVGEKNPNWNGGSSFFPYPPEWTEKLKKFIKDRDNNECQNPFCDHKSKKLDVHHIDYNRQNCSQFNLITLCVSHHRKTSFNRRLWIRFYTKIIWSKYL